MMENLGFAKIRGHPFWPSEITGDMGGRLLVTFLESNKTGTISMKRLRKEWLPLSQAITEKFSTPRNLKRSGFATGMKELVKNTFTFLDDPRSQVDEEQNVSPVVDEIDFSFNHLHSETPEMIDNSDVESVLDEEPNDFHIENIADPSCQKNSSSPCPYLCRECEDFFETEKGQNKIRRNYVKHIFVHNKRKSLKKQFICYYSGCEKSFHFKSYLKRHLKIHTDAMLREIVKKDEPEELVFIVDQTEVLDGKEYHGHLDVSLLDGSQNNEAYSFYSSLGFICKYDLEVWMKMSKILELPVAPDGRKVSVAVAYEVNGLDFTEKVSCFWNSFSSSDVQECVKDVLEVIVDDVISKAELKQSSNEQLLEDTSNVLSSVEYNLLQFNIERALQDKSSLLLLDPTPEWTRTVQEDDDHEPIVDDGGFSLQDGNRDKRSPIDGHKCPKCELSGIRDMENLRQHMKSMHSLPQLCKRCQILFVDMHAFRKHAPDCFFWCTKLGCGFHDKRESRIRAHIRKHSKDLGITVRENEDIRAGVARHIPENEQLGSGFEVNCINGLHMSSVGVSEPVEGGLDGPGERVGITDITEGVLGGGSVHDETIEKEMEEIVSGESEE